MDDCLVAVRDFHRAALAMVMAFLLAVPAKAQQGIIEVDGPRHNFGVIQEGTVAHHTFTIHNSGDVEFTITSVQPSCGCTTPDWTNDPIGPGETGRVDVAFYSEGRPGPFEKSIHVESTADPNRVILYIEGVVEPRGLASGDTLGTLVLSGMRQNPPMVAKGDPLAHPILIKNVGNRPVEITDVRTDAEYVRAEVRQRTIQPGEFVEITIAFETDRMRTGPFNHRVDLVTTDPDVPIKELRLTGLIKEPQP